MEALRSFFEMGGYAAFVWPCFALAAVLLGYLFAASRPRAEEPRAPDAGAACGQPAPPPARRRPGGHPMSRMTRKRRRLYIALLGLLSLGTATALVLTAFEDNLVFFYSPTDIAEQGLTPEQYVRIGGLVEEGSVRQLAGNRVVFKVTDLSNAVAVSYDGILPDLFREGQGVVAQGSIGPDGRTFVAREVLARHDENYMPTEVAEALKASGEWRPESGQAPPR